jgi:hypothetical protein
MVNELPPPPMPNRCTRVEGVEGVEAVYWTVQLVDAAFDDIVITQRLPVGTPCTFVPGRAYTAVFLEV